MKKLEIGDKIYKRIDGLLCYRSRIVKITPTLAITHCGDKFKINAIDGTCRKVPKDKPQFFINDVEYLAETEELKEAFERQKLVRKFKGFDFDKLSLEVLLEINNKLTIK